MRVIIAGGRAFLFGAMEFKRLNQLRTEIPITEVVSGGAAGADSDGILWADERKIPVKLFRADWDKHGKAAGPLRNREMAEYADALIAFPGGRGTANMVAQAQEMGLRVVDLRGTLGT